MFPIIWLVLIFIACSALSYVLCGLARRLFPRFRSGEHKPGTHRPDMPLGGREIKNVELPLVGGPAFTIATVVTGLAAGYLLKFSYEQWTLLFIALGATIGYMIVGFIDDWNKVYSNEGISERAKFLGVFFVSVTAAVLYFALSPAGRVSYSPYKDLPFIHALLCNDPKAGDALVCEVSFGQVAFFGWLIFLIILTGITGSLTSLSVDFSDGLDGLSGGLVFSAAIAFGIVISGIINQQNGIVLEVLSLLCAGSVLGYLPRNWPSSWKARWGKAPRRAKIIMGDSGSLSLGGMLAMIAIFLRQEYLLFMIGGVFVLEGLSALISARLMTRFFRRRLQLLRFASSKEFVPHTEFPLPFLATPLHHHFDLLGWDRRRLVYGAWALGACFAVLGVFSGLAPYPWERWLARILVLILAWIVWSSGSWSKRYFVGLHPAQSTRRRRLALYYGYPYTLMGINLYHLVEIIEASEDMIETPAENIALWQRMNIYDARAMLGLYCYRAGYYPAALTHWTLIPERNRVQRPEIQHLLNEVENRLALEKQETQPMRRDQILRQPPVLTGNLAPADLPNPHEPSHGEQTLEESAANWTSLQPASRLLSEDPEEHRITTTLRSEAPQTPITNGHGTKQTLDVLALNTPQSSSWLSRLLRFPTRK